MNESELSCDTWHEVLIKAGFDAAVARSLIGFISWNKGEEFIKLGREINDLLSGYEGRVFATDAVSKSYGDKALLFFKTSISEETANDIFEAIMKYEQREVYSAEEVAHALDGEYQLQ